MAGAELLIAKGANHLVCERKPYAVEIENGPRVPAHTIIIATGAEYRRLPLDNLSQFEGAGVYHAATFVESQLCRGEEVIVVGGGALAAHAGAASARNQPARRVRRGRRLRGQSQACGVGSRRGLDCDRLRPSGAA